MLEHQLEGASSKKPKPSIIFVICNSIKHKHNYKKLFFYLSVRYRLEYAIEINNLKYKGSFLTHTNPHSTCLHILPHLAYHSYYRTQADRAADIYNTVAKRKIMNHALALKASAHDIGHFQFCSHFIGQNQSHDTQFQESWNMQSQHIW